MKHTSGDDIEWVLVYTTNTELDGRMYQANLQGAGIPCEILSQVDTTRMLNIGELALVKIFVPKEHKEEAILIIKSIEENNSEEAD